MGLGLLLKSRNKPKGAPEARGAESPPTEPQAGSVRQDAALRELGGVHQLICDRRYAFLLEAGSEQALGHRDLAAAWTALEEEMAFVPAGQITSGAPDDADEVSDSSGLVGAAAAPHRTVHVPAFYLDRMAVTNRDFARFVAGGGYDDMQLWPQEIWPSLLQFVDQTGMPGPRYWAQGRPPRGKENHPVVGVCWYEACAYALWLGKRLPAAVEWEKAGSWPADLTGHHPKVRYPWGNSFDPHRANTWLSSREDTVPVDDYSEGCTPNGIYQLIGNVWEWLDDPYHGPPAYGNLRLHLDHPMREVRGGAFNTYFETEATCHFATGQPELDRCNNIGFRCAISADRLRPRQ